MKSTPRLNRTTLAAAMALVLGGLAPSPASLTIGQALAADAPSVHKQKQDYEKRLESVKSLAEALKREAKKTGASNADVLDPVEARLKEADGLAATGEYEIARGVLDEAYKSLAARIGKLKNAQKQTGMATAAEPKATAPRAREAIERELASTRALIDALKRQSAEKNGGKAAEIGAIEADTQAAASLLEAGKLAEAGKLSADAYLRAKSAIASGQKGNAPVSGMSGMADAGEAAKRQRDRVERDIGSTKTLIEALKRQNTEKKGGRDSEIAAIEADTQQAGKLLATGKVEDAGKLITDANFRTKTAIAALQKGNAPVSGMSGMADAAEAAMRQRDRVERDIASTKTLIDALKRQNAEKKAGKDSEIAAIEADTQQAGKLLAAGKVEDAGKLIRDSNGRTKTAIASLQKASDLKSGSAALEAAQRQEAGAMSGEAARSDYARRKDSVSALLQTGKRIASEKNATRAELTQAASLLAEAETLAAAGKFVDGKVRLDHAYLLTKETIRGMRSGEELTASKRFATKADEFAYEQARNDDYQGLIASLVQGQADPSWGQAAAKARRLRDEADTIGKAGDYQAALRKIDQSTGELKTLLRRAGFPII